MRARARRASTRFVRRRERAAFLSVPTLALSPVFFSPSLFPFPAEQSRSFRSAPFNACDRKNAAIHCCKSQQIVCKMHTYLSMTYLSLQNAYLLISADRFENEPNSPEFAKMSPKCSQKFAPRVPVAPARAPARACPAPAPAPRSAAAPRRRPGPRARPRRLPRPSSAREASRARVASDYYRSIPWAKDGDTVPGDDKGHTTQQKENIVLCS